MNLKELKIAFERSNGDLYFVADDPTKKAIRKKLTTPPLQGVVDITIKMRSDGVEIVYLPKSKRNIYAFEHLLVIDPKEEMEIVVKEVPKKEEPKKEEPKKEESKKEESKKEVFEDKKIKPMSINEDIAIPTRGESKNQ